MAKKIGWFFIFSVLFLVSWRIFRLDIRIPRNLHKAQVYLNLQNKIELVQTLPGSFTEINLPIFGEKSWKVEGAGEQRKVELFKIEKVGNKLILRAQPQAFGSRNLIIKTKIGPQNFTQTYRIVVKKDLNINGKVDVRLKMLYEGTLNSFEKRAVKYANGFFPESDITIDKGGGYGEAMWTRTVAPLVFLKNGRYLEAQGILNFLFENLGEYSLKNYRLIDPPDREEQVDAEAQFLLNYALYVKETGDTEFHDKNWERATKLANRIMEKFYNPNFGLVLNPYWEAVQKQFQDVYDITTQAAISVALENLADLAKEKEDKKLEENYQRYSQLISQGINKNLVTEIDGKKVYAAMRDKNGRLDNSEFGLSTIFPVAIGWNDYDPQVMENTYRQSLENNFVWQGDRGNFLLPRPILGLEKDALWTAGKYLAWLIFYADKVGDIKTKEELLGFLINYTQKPQDLLAESFWYSGGQPPNPFNKPYLPNPDLGDWTTDSGNADGAGWQLLIIDNLFFPK